MTPDSEEGRDYVPAQYAQDDQVSWVEPVEKIAEFEAALSVVEITQNEGKRGIILPCDRGGSCRALVDPVIVEQIQDMIDAYRREE